MKKRTAPFALYGMVLSLSFSSLVTSQKPNVHSTSSKCGDNCSSFQHSDSLPEQPPPGTIRLAIGGDSRDDRYGVVPWAFGKARARSAKAFFFLGDMEITSLEDKRFAKQVAEGVSGISFYPVL
jgi:hypothetical protein